MFSQFSQSKDSPYYRPRQTTKEAGSTTPNLVFKQLQSNRPYFQKERAYLSISKAKKFNGPGNNAQRIIIPLDDDTPGVLKSHLTITSLFDHRSQDKDKPFKPLRCHLHYTATVKCKASGANKTVRVYCAYHQEDKPEFYLHDKSDHQLDPITKKALKKSAHVFMLPIIDQVNQHITKFEEKKQRLEEEIEKINSKLASATTLEIKLKLSLELCGLYENWLRHINSKDYRDVTHFWNSFLKKQDNYGFTVQTSRGNFTKNKRDRILERAFRKNRTDLHRSINILQNLISRQSQSLENHQTITSKPAKSQRKKARANKPDHGKNQQTRAKSPTLTAKDELEIILNRALNRRHTIDKLQDTLKAGDIPGFDQYLQAKIFANECILFDLDTESLIILCRQENSETLKSILISQKDALISGAKHHKNTLVMLIKTAIELGNVKLLVTLDRLGLNPDRILFENTRKSFMQHLISHVYEYDNEEFAVWLFTELYKQKMHFPHAQEKFKIDFLDTSLRVNALQCLVYSGFFKLALCLSQAGTIDKASSTRYKGERRQIAACGFLITAIVKEGISQEKLDLLVALASGHDIATSQHLISIYRGLYVSAIQNQGGNELEKLIRLIDTLAKLSVINIYKQDSAKILPFYMHPALAYQGIIQEYQHQLGHTRTMRNPHAISQYRVGEALGWLTMLKLAIHCTICHKSVQADDRARQARQLLQALSNLKKRNLSLEPLRTSLMLVDGVEVCFQPLRVFHPAHIMEVFAHKLLKLAEKSNCDNPAQIIDLIQQQVLTALEGTEFEALKNAKKHVTTVFSLIPPSQPMHASSPPQVREIPAAQPTVDETKPAEEGGNEATMLFFENQQATRKSTPATVMTSECS
ncbi:hypothetical protein AVI53_11730 [Piscirickettsia salmonis]|nr:hypothetical protein PSLF89_849 [Piscirickettsia salmonis LF-89 = ATCC VR-1361]ALY01752.1 hypothetical protein AWE47_01780 [Piscirickettsia salmonis]AMA41267.1 hypothetical protein AWJ11_01785 [Piscirickettsia salmonis]AOS36463.1 hypothetical protein AVM72_14775 [Piscirickettsia salmonis]APS61146.1 hypothetical protein AVI53_11730 [Piscirickettsia salmonis]